MRAVEHYTYAEQLLDMAGDDENGSDQERYHLAAAQAHATLALAGATALQAYSQGGEPELDDWQFAAGGEQL